MTVVLVCGGRTYNDKDRLNQVLSMIHSRRPFSLLIHGDAPGADTLAQKWAEVNGVPWKAFPADWKKAPRAGGFLRNQQMLDEGKPNLVVAFPGGNGTADMKRRAYAAGVKVVELNAGPIVVE